MPSLLTEISIDYQSAEFTCMFLYDKKVTNKLIQRKLFVSNKTHYTVFVDTVNNPMSSLSVRRLQLPDLLLL